LEKGKQKKEGKKRKAKEQKRKKEEQLNFNTCIKRKREA